GLSIAISLFMNWYNSRVALKEREVMTTATDIAEAQLKMPIQREPDVGRRLLHRTLKPLIGTPVNAIVTLVCLWVLWLGVKGAYAWVVTRAVTEGGAQACKVGHG